MSNSNTTTGEAIATAIGAAIAAVGPEIVHAVFAHGTDNAAIPPEARAKLRAILYPNGGNKLASELEHDADVAAAAPPLPPLFPVDDGKDSVP